jgi:hydrogenase/urease accessory protein HupE
MGLSCIPFSLFRFPLLVVACQNPSVIDRRKPFSRAATFAFAVLIVVLCAPAASVRLAAHPAPFSYLDLYLSSTGLSGRLVVHDLDLVYELKLDAPARLSDQSFLDRQTSTLGSLLSSRLRLLPDGRSVPWTITSLRRVPGQDAVEMAWTTPATRMPGKLTISAHVFPYDPNHQTFVSIYEEGTLARQEVLSDRRTSVDFFTGTRQGLLAVFRTFTASGIHHIAIGPDHILFIVGLLLLGGSLTRLLTIVTAFTVGHSITLALATLQILDPPSRIIEPAIALSIVYVGADNLLTGTSGRDVRAWVALVFGLIHGFGFASVLRDAGLPNRALGMSLFSFNLGVEIGQAAIVLVVATGLSLLRRKNASLARHVTTAGSVGVMLAGAFWFFQRTF